MKLVLFIFSVVFLQQLLARSVQNDEYTRLDEGQLRIIEEQINYLVNYGYLDKINTGSQKEITKAIRAFQRFLSLPITGIVDELTIAYMETPRCGNQDVFKDRPRYMHSQLGGWNKTHLTYYLVNVTEPLTLERAAELTETALDRWGSTVGFTFTRAYDTSADIVIDFRETVHGDGLNFGGLSFAHAFGPNSPLHAGEVHLWSPLNWTFHAESNKHETDFYSIILHEFGHSLGLEHSRARDAFMNPLYGIYRPDEYLTSDDTSAIYHLYYSNCEYCKLKNN